MEAASTSQPPDERLLAYLREKLARPALAYLQAPRQVHGGYDALIYAFQLKGAPPDFSKRLIVRIFRDAGGGERAAFETAVQNTLAEAGYPVPRVVDVCRDASVLGGAFMVMHLVEGITLLDAIAKPSTMVFRAGALLAEAHVQLHALDPVPVILALEAAGVPVPPSGHDAWLATMKQSLEAIDAPGLRAGLAWLEANRPKPATRRSVLHLDFHPVNVLVEDGHVSGVIDWGNIGFGDAAADVGTTIMELTMGPLGLPAWARPPMDLLRAWLARRYLAAYRGRSRVSPAAVRYFEALKCFAAMLHVAEIRLAARRGVQVPETYAWSGAREVARVSARFRKLTGVALQLPG